MRAMLKTLTMRHAIIIEGFATMYREVCTNTRTALR